MQWFTVSQQQVKAVTCPAAEKLGSKEPFLLTPVGLTWYKRAPRPSSWCLCSTTNVSMWGLVQCNWPDFACQLCFSVIALFWVALFKSGAEQPQCKSELGPGAQKKGYETSWGGGWLSARGGMRAEVCRRSISLDQGEERWFATPDLHLP